MNAYCDCGKRATRRALVGHDPICERCYLLDGETVVDGAVIVELASGDAVLTELASAIGSDRRQLLRNMQRLTEIGRVIEYQDTPGGEKLYRLANPMRVRMLRGRPFVEPVQPQLELAICMEAR